MINKKLKLAFICVVIVIIFSFLLSKQNSNLENQNIFLNRNKVKEKIISLYKSKKENLPEHNVVCVPETKSHCSVDGCKEVEPTVFILVGSNPVSKEINMSRCDTKPCDTYGVNFVGGESYWSLETKEPHGLIFKSSKDDHSYIEIVTTGTEAFVSNGFCYGEKTIK